LRPVENIDPSKNESAAVAACLVDQRQHWLSVFQATIESNWHFVIMLARLIAARIEFENRARIEAAKQKHAIPQFPMGCPPEVLFFEVVMASGSPATLREGHEQPCKDDNHQRGHDKCRYSLHNPGKAIDRQSH
jgi:hypothetical protein